MYANKHSFAVIENINVQNRFMPSDAVNAEITAECIRIRVIYETADKSANNSAFSWIWHHQIDWRMPFGKHLRLTLSWTTID